MAERFLDLAPEERADILNTQADRLGRVSFVLEKDIWVCWVLDHLFFEEVIERLRTLEAQINRVS